MTRKYATQQGFTIIEMMVTLIILAIISSLAGPSFTKMIRESRVKTASNSLMTGFNLARSEAIRRGKAIHLCAVNDPTASPPVCNGAANGWLTGWVMFINTDNDDPIVIDAGEEIRIGDPMNGVTVVGPAGGMVTFSPRGQPTAGAGDYTFNANGCEAGVDKQISVELGSVGRSRITTDNDANGTEEFCP